MTLDQFQQALARLGIDATHTRKCELTCADASQRMVLVVSTFARNEDGKRFVVFDGDAGTRVAATEQHVVGLAEFVAALTDPGLAKTG